MSTGKSNGKRLARQLGLLLETIEATGQAVLPSSNLELLQSIVDAAARIFGAAAASVALIDEEQSMLEFKVASGAGQEQVVGMRIPMDKGIAGYVAMTGQPIAVSNVQQDPRFNQDFAESTGYVPRSILATPLVSGDTVIGVMEVLDKIDAPSFGMQDMELLGMFAQQAAISIDQSQNYERLGDLILDGIRQLLISDPDSDPAELFQALDGLEASAKGRSTDLIQLAKRFYAISTLGESEQKACLQILAAFEEYARSKPGSLTRPFRSRKT
jgi:GAF domain-containing protein